LDGQAYGVPAAAVNDWNGHGGEVAIFANGGWVFLTPATGWRAWIEDRFSAAVFDGQSWRQDALALSTNGAVSSHRIMEFDHVIAPGASSSTVQSIENSASVIGITGRVISEITGTGVTGWSLGVAGSVDRYGTGLSLASGSWMRGMTSYPMTYWGNETLLLTAIGGDFAAGMVRFAVHYQSLEPPRV